MCHKRSKVIKNVSQGIKRMDVNTLPTTIDQQSIFQRTELNKTKHIDITFHNVRENIDNGMLNINYIPSSLNVADVLTKAMT